MTSEAIRTAVWLAFEGTSTLVGLLLLGPVLRAFLYRPAWERKGTCAGCGKPYSECSVALWG